VSWRRCAKRPAFHSDKPVDSGDQPGTLRVYHFRITDKPAELTIVTVHDFDEVHEGLVNRYGARLITAYPKNLHSLSAAQRAFIADKLRTRYDHEAKQRQRESGGNKGWKPRESSLAVVVKHPPRSYSSKSRDQAGRECGVSGSYVDMARDIKAHRSDLITAVESGDLPITKAAAMARQIKSLAKST
jgi:hypothetical protein